MYVAKYSKEKPVKCRDCLFGTQKGKCILGPCNCYYVIKVFEKKTDDCDRCPYKRKGPCVGWCTRRVLGQKICYDYPGDYDENEKANGNI